MMTSISMASEPLPIAAEHVVLTGRVQGIGLRPAVARWAIECGVTGEVRNSSHGVDIVVEGGIDAVARFCDQLVEHLPEMARVFEIERGSVEPIGRATFAIIEGRGAGPPAAELPADIGVCGDCLADVARADDRRRDYPLTSCAQCGPRYSIHDAMPYERGQTAMRQFAMCPLCRHEYESPTDRRFHAQTIACPACGPVVWLADAGGSILARRVEAIAAAAKALCEGAIVALRGVGGYQLLVDATSPHAVARLRERKCRPGKPLAVLVESLRAADDVAHLDHAERQALAAPANPIVVCRLRSPSKLAADVHGGLDTVGLLLPTTPLHAMVAWACRRPLVATSGNRDGDPLVFGVAAAQRELAAIADLWLHHDRPIRRAVDDSVVRVMAGRPVTLRLARGLSPLPLDLARGVAALAVGGHQKSAVALANRAQSVLAPHVGDLDSPASRERFESHVDDLLQLYGAQPEWIAHDLHPDYFTTRWAEDQRCPRIAVQHHHAHVVAGMLEQGWLDREVLGAALDGTGYGPDGTIWGGEFLRATVQGFRRVGHLRPFSLVGGEAAVRQPWRAAVAVAREALGREAAARLSFSGIPAKHVALAIDIADRPGCSPRTTSAGRLFDAVAALVLNITQVVFEGQGAMLLEACCDPAAEGEYELPLKGGEPFELDWRGMIAALVRDRGAGVPPGTLAMRFHRALATAIVRVGQRYPELPLVLSGGVFQNRRLVELVAERCASRRERLGLAGRIPPNDGGLAAGQLAVALAQTQAMKAGRSSCA